MNSNFLIELHDVGKSFRAADGTARHVLEHVDFTLREGEIVATTGELMTFKANNVVGSPDVPTAINFVRADYENGKWYTVSGLQLQQKPKRKGLYIYNGRKVVLK